MSKNTDNKPTEPVDKKVIKCIGRVAGVNSSLAILLADVEVAENFQGTCNEEDGDWETSDYGTTGGGSHFELEDGRYGVGVDLGVGNGIIDIFQVDDYFVLFEGNIVGDDDEEIDTDDIDPTSEVGMLFHQYLGSDPENEEPVDIFEVKSGFLAILPTLDSGEGIEDAARAMSAVVEDFSGKDGEGCGLIMKVTPGVYGIYEEGGDNEEAWGSGGRCVIKLLPPKK